MFYFLLTLTVISAVSLAVGFVWIILSSGVVQRRSGKQVGAELMDDQMSEEDDEVAISAQRSAFKGAAAQVSVEASYSFREIKDQLVTGNWRQVLPAMVAIAGLSGLLLFGSMSLYMFLEDKWVGILMIVLVVYTLVRILVEFARA